jgi:cobalt-zinc-cadmium efflux system outer membrane protein
VTILRHDVLPKAQQTFEAAQQGYRQGKFDYLHLLDAQRTLFQTQMRYIDSVETYHRAQADVARLTGRSLDTESDGGRPSQPVQDSSAQVK